jgi:hypothetical protein
MADAGSDEGDGGPSERLQVYLDPQTIRYLEAIVATNTYGRKASRVARALIEQGVRGAIKDGLIEVERR